MMGDDHARISAASKLAAKEIGCKVFKGSPYYRKEGACLPHPIKNHMVERPYSLHSLRALMISEYRALLSPLSDVEVGLSCVHGRALAGPL